VQPERQRVRPNRVRVKLAAKGVEKKVTAKPLTEMLTTTTDDQTSPALDEYRGAQLEVIIRGAGFLWAVGAATALALTPFFPPTAQIGQAGWLIVLPLMVGGLVVGVLCLTLKHRPSIATIHATSFTGAAQVALLAWLAGGGRAPYTQLLVLTTIGSAGGQDVRRCVYVLLAATTAALSPLLYSSIDLPLIVTELSMLSVMTLMISAVMSGTRDHRARLKDAGEEAKALAHVDPLTGMLNRRAFDEALALAVERARFDNTPVSLLLCDVNHFKEINDGFGHTAGDAVLRAIAEALADAVRRPDIAFRWAGDEFAVILRDSDSVGGRRMAARLREAVVRCCRRPDGLPVTIGTGVAELIAGMSCDEVLVAADEALCSHKTQRTRLRGAA
jgi:diguanylate cyclase (GGDEF)-like protein